MSRFLRTESLSQCHERFVVCCKKFRWYHWYLWLTNFSNAMANVSKLLSVRIHWIALIFDYSLQPPSPNSVIYSKPRGAINTYKVVITALHPDISKDSRPILRFSTQAVFPRLRRVIIETTDKVDGWWSSASNDGWPSDDLWSPSITYQWNLIGSFWIQRSSLWVESSALIQRCSWEGQCI